MRADFSLHFVETEMLKPRVERLEQSQLSEKYKVSYAIRLTPCTNELVYERKRN